jgi:hypothetical protein
MKKFMKGSKLKNIVVKCLNWSEEIEIDSSIFDDIYMEAATQIIEKNKNIPNFSVAIIMECYEKKDEKKPDKHFIYNTYFVLINAGLYEKAELLRLNFLKLHGIDIQKQSLKGDESGDQQSQTPGNN